MRYEYMRELNSGKVVRECVTMPAGLPDDVTENIFSTFEGKEYGSIIDIRTLADVWLVGSGFCTADKMKDLSVCQALIDFRAFRTAYMSEDDSKAIDTMRKLFDDLHLPYSANKGRMKKLATLLGMKKSHKRTTGNVDIVMKDDRAFYVEVCKWLYATFQIKYVAETTYREIKTE